MRRQLPAIAQMARSSRSQWSYYAHRLLQKVSGGRAGFFSYVVVAQPVGTSRGPSLRTDPRTRVGVIAAGDPLIAAFPRPASVNKARFEAGSRCHVVTVDGVFAGHIWIAERAFDEDEVRCRFVLPCQPLCCWDFDVYVSPQYRAGRTMARLWQAVDADLSRRGHAWTLSRIARGNRASLLAHERLGALPLATVNFLVLGPLQVMYGSCRPWVHIGVARMSQPAIELPAPEPAASGADNRTTT